MRDALAAYEGRRITVTATVMKHSMRLGWAGVREPTILLSTITMVDGTLLTDHVWLTVGKRLAAADLHQGDVVQFSARVALYRRGFHREPDGTVHFTEDAGLGFPTQICVLTRRVVPDAEAIPNPVTVAATSAARQRILTAIADLQRELQAPPSLPRLLDHIKANPMTLAATLRKMAQAGVIAFTPNGSVMTFASPTGGQ